MTPKQITNMRNVMVTMFGPVALILPDSDVIAFRDEIQRRANALPTDLESDVRAVEPASVETQNGELK